MKDSIDFGSMDIPKLFRKLLIPTVLGMIFSAIFIITDGIFVGTSNPQLSSSASFLRLNVLSSLN